MGLSILVIPVARISARTGIHIHGRRPSRTDRGYGFRARAFGAPRNDGANANVWNTHP
jgi:hypothetical protein